MKWAAFLVVLAIAAYALRPDVASLEDKVGRDLVSVAEDLSVTEADDVVSGVLKVTCSINAAQCAQLIQAAMDVETADFYVAREARVTIAGEPALRCVGAFTQWTCWRDA